MYTLQVNNPDKLYFTSDTHIGHFNICKYCNRPFETRSEMDNTLIGNWNEKVPSDAVLVHCGDFMLPHKEDIKEYWKYISKLNGKIYLCRGNHDRIKVGQYTSDGEYHDINEQVDDVKLVVVDMLMIEVESIKIFAQHYPAISFNGDYQVFGHIHTRNDGLCYGMDGYANDILRKNQYDVGVDQNDYYPVSYWELTEIFLKKANQSNK